MNAFLEFGGLGLAQTAALLGVAPLLNGVIRKTKARFQVRRGPSVWQNYYDLAKWFARSEKVAAPTSFVHRLAPMGVLGPVLAAALFVPVFGTRPPLQSSGDLIAVIGLLALARAWLTLAGLDSGSSFGAMGTSRELAISALVEPVVMLSLIALCVSANTTRLGEIVAFGAAHPTDFYGLGWLLAALAFATAVVAETGRIPFDNPDTHLELTMVHEGMLIEYSGRSLGLLNLAAMVKQLLLCLLFVNVFIPSGMAGHGVGGLGLALCLVILKLAGVAVALAVCESSFAKMRLFQLPDLIGSAAGGAMLAVALVVLFA